MLSLLVVAQISISVQSGSTSKRDSVRIERQAAHWDSVAARRDSLRAHRDSVEKARAAALRLPVTPAVLASAFHDPAARDLLERARAARMTQDSALKSYDATAYERFSLRSKLGFFGRDRLAMRFERAARVRWARDKGVVADITGSRAVSPIMGDTKVSVGGTGLIPVPYYPGKETLWIGSGVARMDVDPTEVVHPLAKGAEAYYTYASGDSVRFTLPGGRTIVVRELRVAPRRPHWNVVVGSLWFDVSSGQLVRGVYRMAAPFDVYRDTKDADDPNDKDDDGVPGWLQALVTPMRGSADVMTVDYGLFEGRFWLPRSETVEGKAEAGILRVPFELTQHYDYESVNAVVDVPVAQLTATDTGTTVEAHRARREAYRQACAHDTGFVRETRRVRRESGVTMVVRMTCDTLALATSPTLPRSIYDSPDSLAPNHDFDDLVSRALALGRQSELAPQPVVLRYGLGLTRYNRIEGFSTAIDASRDLGAGYSTHALFRLGTDLSPNGEIGASRTNGRETYTASVYRRLNSANDWGNNPFSLGASLSALAFGHDDGVYYRSWGAELVRDADQSIVDSWRLFAEHEFDARVSTRFSLVGRLRGGRFPNNIDVTNGSVVGLALRKRGAVGDDPNGARLSSDARVEGAAGSFDYARGMLDLTLSAPLTHSIATALTVSGGTSGGHLPTQRLFYLGGTSTVRGQDVGVAVGDAYWLTRAEVGFGSVAARPVVFADLGWAGDRHNWTTGVVPVSGAGIGASFLDGLVRADLAKGIRPVSGVRASVYLDARF